MRQSELGGEINHELIKSIKRTLVHRARGSADASAVAEAAIGTWHEAALRLAPVIGWQGVDVLFRRSLRVTGKTFPGLELVGNEADHGALLASLQAHLAGCDAAPAMAASDALLVTFIDILAGLIGESLTEHLLGPIWAPPLAASEQE